VRGLLSCQFKTAGHRGALLVWAGGASPVAFGFVLAAWRSPSRNCAVRNRDRYWGDRGCILPEDRPCRQNTPRTKAASPRRVKSLWRRTIQNDRSGDSDIFASCSPSGDMRWSCSSRASSCGLWSFPYADSHTSATSRCATVCRGPRAAFARDKYKYRTTCYSPHRRRRAASDHRFECAAGFTEFESGT
jgi:hypothetical protein